MIVDQYVVFYFDFFPFPIVDNAQFLGFFEVLCPVLKIEWDVCESTYGASIEKVL